MEASTDSARTAQPAAPYDVSSGAQPKTLAEAEASFAAAENQVVALVGSGPKPLPLSTDGCGIACKALASMKRSTVRLCDLAADEPARCDDAKSRLDRASARVKEVCGECSDSAG